MASPGGRLSFDRLNPRIGVIAAVASAAWVGQSLASLALPDPTAVLDVTMIVPVLLTVTGIWRLKQQGAMGMAYFPAWWPRLPRSRRSLWFRARCHLHPNGTD